MTRTAEASAAEPDVLLATKLHVPQPRPGLLLRPRLLEHLARATAQELTLVCAPAGFGKTSLLGDWARRAGRPVAWLSLDAGDNDPVRFWRYVAAALDGAGSPWLSGSPRCRAGPAGLAEGGRDRPDQRAGRPVRAGRAPAGRLPPHPGAADP